MCEAVETDVKFASILAKKYPTKVFLLRYEDFALKPYRTLDVVLNFLELLPEPCMDTYLETHTGITRQKLLANMTKNTYSSLSKKRAAHFILFRNFPARLKFLNSSFANFQTLIDFQMNGISLFWPFLT